MRPGVIEKGPTVVIGIGRVFGAALEGRQSLPAIDTDAAE